MRLNKIILITFLTLITFTIGSAQRGIHSDAYGKSVYWKKGNVHYQSIKKSIAPSGIYSKALGKTVFIGNNQTTTNTRSKIASAPNLVFVNANTDWSIIQKDESLPELTDIFPQITSEITGYELILEASLITDNKFIELYRTGNNFGSYVICTDLETGAKIWDQTYNLTNDEKIEIDLSMFIRSDGNLEISGMRLLSPNVPNIFPFGIATRKIVNIQTGELVQRNFSTFEEGGVICNNPNGQFGRTIPIAEDMSYLTSCSYPSTDGKYVQIQFLMDKNGKLLDTIGFVPNVLDGQNIEVHKYIEAYRLPNNNVVIGSSSTSNPTDPNQTFSELIILNPTGEFIERIDVSTFLNYTTFFDMKVEGEYILLSTITFEDFSDPLSYLNHILVLNQDGEILLSVNGFRELDGESVRNIKITSLGNNEFLLVASADNHCLKYFKISNNLDIQHLKTICLEEEMWFTDPTDIRITADGSIITSGSWAMEESGDTESFKGTFKMPASELGITSSVNTIADKIDDSFRVYPNPVGADLTIELNEKSNGTIQIYNSMGAKVMQRQLNNQETVQLQVSSLLEGVYNVVLNERDGVKSSLFVKSRE